MSKHRSPPRLTATYRLQFRNGMTFDRAVALVPYLRRLGISHLYASPIFQATSGSTHGYDIIDHNCIEPAIGGEAGFARLHAALRAADMGLILDIVPNHMAASLENSWWRHVVEHGEAGPYAHFFDVDWDRKLTLPLLGKDLAEAIEDADLALDLDETSGGLVLSCPGHNVPLHPESYARVEARLEGEARSLVQELVQLARARRHWPAGTAEGTVAPGSVAHGLLRAQLAVMSQDKNFLAELHDAQPWRLTFWKEAHISLSYRRFFEVSGLVGVRVEEDDVFAAVHRLTLDLIRRGMVDGLRIDHVDGLAYPTAYLRRLRQEVGPDFPLLVEKILAKGETLPADWPDCGTTGYEFIAAIPDLQVDGAGLAALAQSYGKFVGREVDTEREARRAKLLMLRRNFRGELGSLAKMAIRFAEELGQASFSAEAMEEAIAEIIIGLDVYRTYGEFGPIDPQGSAVIEEAVAEALASGDADADIIEFIERLLRDGEADQSMGPGNFRARFQQLTGPIMAKAVEDTLFYRVNHLIALNEVGSDPGRLMGAVDHFHEAMAARLSQPRGLLATSTHDTKRGEDARARLYALTECAEEWSSGVARWREMNAPLLQVSDRREIPDRALQWLIYQALAGVWPHGLGANDADGLAALADRFSAYVVKAAREAKLHTDWLSVDEAYEAKVEAFARGLLEPDNQRFLADFVATIEPVMAAGAFNSLSQTLAKLAAPGIPDIYQGAEGMDLSLVDPDNRTPVDFAQLAAMLDLSEGHEASRLSPIDGSLKQWLIAQVLRLRQTHAALFEQGSYQPLTLSGPSAAHHPGFLREMDGAAAIVILNRLPLSSARERVSLAGRDITVPAKVSGWKFRNVFTGQTFSGEALALDKFLGGLPVALAISTD